MKIKALVAIAILAFIGVAGCIQDQKQSFKNGWGGQPNLQDLESSLRKFNDAISTQTEIRSIYLDLDISGYSWVSFAEFGESGSIHFRESWGGIAPSVYCSNEKTVWESDGEVYQARRSNLTTCSRYIEDFKQNLSTARTLRSVESSAIGGSLWSVNETQDGEDYTVAYELDSQNRLLGYQIQSVSVKGSMIVDSGPRRDVVLPEATGRLAASIGRTGEFERDTNDDQTGYIWEHTSGDDFIGLEEFEVRVGRYSGTSNGYSKLYATFPLDTAFAQANGFTYRFQDNGDGILNPGDSFAIKNSNWNGEGSFVGIVWDKWADAPINYLPWCSPYC